MCLSCLIVSGLNFHGPGLVLSESTRYYPVAEVEETVAVPLKWELGDKTLVQIDLSSLNPESGSLDVMTLYKYLVTLERVKRVTTYDLSYSECARKLQGAGDSFDVKPKNAHAYKCMPDLTKAMTCKTVFFNSAQVIESGKGLLTVFRFRSLDLLSSRSFCIFVSK